MRTQPYWPRTLRDWFSGLWASAPFALLLLHSRGIDTASAALWASVAIVLSIPWVIPATMLFAVLSAPVYMWLHTQGPVPGVLDWLGGIVLIAAVAGCHINAALLLTWRRARQSTADETGLRDFLVRHGQHK
ncbi:MAG TPA: hypothetical protein VE421_00620 [Burkholderiaceae bacterium]|nr:hypothetical protein [Burkholderiaceae bacterium]